MTTQTFLIGQSAAKYHPIRIDLQYGHELPGSCIKLAKSLTNQPLFYGKGLESGKYKVISLANYGDARICEIFNINAEQYLGVENSWHIGSFGCSIQPSSAGYLINQGISLSLFNQVNLCSYEVLEKSYNIVFVNMITGWENTKLENHPNITLKKDPQVFELFAKVSSLIDEQALVSFMVKKFSLQNDVGCCEDHCDKGKIYLWIRKIALESAKKKIGFKL